MGSAMHDKLGRRWFAVLAATLVLGLLGGCGHRPAGPRPIAGQEAAPATAQGPAAGPQATAAGAAPAVGTVRHYDVMGEPLAKGLLVGDAKVFENLTVLPILAKEQPYIGPVISLDTALESGKAEVREVGGDAAQQQAVQVQQAQASQPAPQQPAPQHSQPQPAHPSAPNAPIQQVGNVMAGGAQVGKLVIGNKGEVPIFVLAGTVVKGGKQDRQIGQDFIVPPLSQVPVDAFCVEQGRWNATRGGKSTGGKFTTVKQLATAKVRGAGQYKGQQGEVWQEVAAVNKAHKKSSSSDTLMATLDDPEVVRQRHQLAAAVARHLDTVRPGGAVVGFAYAVDGRLKGVRWFVNHEVFALFRETLVNTSAVDALTARAGAPPKPPPAVAPKAVARFVAEVDKMRAQKVEETAGANVNEYRESKDAYGSSTIMKRPAKPAVKMSSDYLAK